jgi:hypothetical protein
MSAVQLWDVGRIAAAERGSACTGGGRRLSQVQDRWCFS